ncbi:MAG: hypothetical protein ACE5JS_00775 [Nitrospinota bacterium]
MPRISEVDVTQAPSEVRAVFDKQMEDFGVHFNSSKVYAHVPSIMFAASDLAQAIFDAPHVEIELLALANVRVAQINGCPF